MLKFISFVALIVLFACKDQLADTQPPDIPIEQLLAAPDTILVEGRELYLETYIWRDFMPVSPPDGKPMNAALYITATDTAKLPSSISADAAWIVYEQQVWKSWLEEIPPQIPNQLGKTARNGPTWGPFVNVSAIVRVIDSEGKQFMLQAANQLVHRTD